MARVIARRGSQKIRNVLAAGPGDARVAVTGIDGRHWSTLQGHGVVRTDCRERRRTGHGNWSRALTVFRACGRRAPVLLQYQCTHRELSITERSTATPQHHD